MRCGTGNIFFLKINIFKFEAAVDVNKCFTQIKLPNLRQACMTYPDLPSYLSTMVRHVNNAVEYKKKVGSEFQLKEGEMGKLFSSFQAALGLLQTGVHTGIYIYFVYIL